MPKTFGIAILFLLSVMIPLPLNAETIDAKSTISEVTVYPDRALVTRAATVDLTPGKYEIKIGPLPNAIEEESVSARGKGTAKVHLFGAQLATTQLDDPQSDRVRQIKDEINRLQDRQQQLADREGILNEKRDFLASIKAASGEQIGKDLVTKQPSVSDATAILDLLDKELSAINKESVSLRTESRDTASQIDKLNRELRELSGNLSLAEKTIVVELEAETQGSFNLEVSYRLPGASWEPVYEARAKGGSAEVNFISYGLIRQNTGEDWNNVTLRLSTAKPGIAGRMPETEPWYLRKMENYPVPRRKGDLMLMRESLSETRQEMAAADHYESLAAAPPAVQEAEMMTASASESTTSVSFTLPKSESIQSDWQPKKAPVSSTTLKAKLAFEISPRLSPFAYLRAKVQNTTGSILLAGRVQIFMDESFVGSSVIRNIGTEEEFDLFLGIDERIKVERKQLRAKEDVSVLPSVHGRIKSIDYEYVTRVENFRTADSDILVIDQVPISQHDEIKVEQIFIDPKPTETDEEKPGVSKWAFLLAPGAKKEFRLTYRVKYPVDFDINGL